MMSTPKRETVFVRECDLANFGVKDLTKQTPQAGFLAVKPGAEIRDDLVATGVFKDLDLPTKVLLLIV